MSSSSETAFNDWLRQMQQGMSESQGELLKRMQPALAAFAGFGASAAAVAAKGFTREGARPDLGEAGAALEKFLNSVLTGSFTDTAMGKGGVLPELFEQLGPLSAMFGPGQIIKRRLVRIQEANERYQKATQAYAQQCAGFGPEVVERFTAQTMAAGEQAAQTPEAAFETLMGMADHALEDFSERESYRKAASEMLNAGVALVQTYRDCWDDSCAELDLPNRQQIEALREENRALSARIEKLERQLADAEQSGQAAPSAAEPEFKRKTKASAKKKKRTPVKKASSKPGAVRKTRTAPNSDGGFDIASLGADPDGD